MKKQAVMTEVQEKQSYNHANIVYLSPLIAVFFIIPIFIYIGNLVLILLCVTTIVASYVALKLNKLKYYGLASLIFIGFITLQTVFEVIFFDMRAGFVYYFFNMSGLIIYTNWTNKQKIIGVAVEISLFIITFFYSFFYDAVVILPNELLIFFHISNIIFNIVGVTNSAFYYVKIADKAQIRLSKLALDDYLTELPNRTAIAQYFDQMNLVTEWYEKDLAIVMIDIDHFKEINDGYGHLVGDVILKKLGKILYHQKREHDFLARYGGEEFIMVIPTDSLFKLGEITEDYRLKIETALFEVGDYTLKITISLGAFLKPSQKEMTYQEAIEIADALLYQAKQDGRNRVVMRSY